MAAQLEFVPCFIPSHYQSFTQQIRYVEKCGLEQSQGELQFRKVLILLRGLPGSGKSTLAHVLHEVLGACVTSADDYFLTSAKVYQYDQSRLSEAHKVCQSKARSLMEMNKQFVVVDNTNITALEMEPYVRMAMKYDYEIILLEPNTPWKNNALQLAQRNTHRVPQKKIIQMKQRFEKASQVNKCFAMIRRQVVVTKSTSNTANTSSTCSSAANSSLSSSSNTSDTSDSTNLQDYQANPTIVEDAFTSLPNPITTSTTTCSVTERHNDVNYLISLFPHLQLEHIEEMYAITDGNCEHTVELLRHVEPVPGTHSDLVSSTVTVTEISSHSVVGSDTVVTIEDNLLNDSGRSNCQDKEISCSSSQPSNCIDKPAMNSEPVNVESVFPSSSMTAAVNAALEVNNQSIMMPPSDAALIGGPISSTTLFASENQASIQLSRDFLYDAQNQFGLELGLQQIDIDFLPPETYQCWRPPPHVAKLIYASFMESLGVLPASSSSPQQYNTINVEVQSPERHRWHSECGTQSSACVLPPKLSHTSEMISAVPCSSQLPCDTECCLPFREIMDIDLALERSIQDQLPWLNQVSSRMKLRLLKEMFPNIEMNHLEALCVQFDFSTATLLDHLLGLGHTPKPTQEFTGAWGNNVTNNQEDDSIAAMDPHLAFLLGRNEGLSNTEEVISLLKQRLEEERERRSYMQRKMQETFSRKSPAGVALFYQSELATSNRYIVALEKHIASRTIEVRRAQEGLNRLDIHHLNVRNAMEQVKKRIEEIRLGSSNGIRQTLTIVTGRGLHSIGPARLRPAIKKFLTDNNYRYQEPGDGYFVVNLSLR